MATHIQKLHAENRMRELLRTGGLSQPDVVEYGETCVRFFFEESMTCVVVDIDEDGSARIDEPEPDAERLSRPAAPVAP